MDKLETENIFIDTSIFQQSNFLAGRKIKRLIEYAEESEIKLYTSDIIIKEIKEQVRKNISKSKSAIKQLAIKNDKEIVIFRNTDTFEIIEQLRNIDYEAEIVKICTEVDKVIEEYFTVIPYGKIDISNVFNRYFENKPPFKEGLKKNEFPDAFVLEIIEKWCEKNNEKIIAISSDKDWLNYKSDNIEPIESMDDLLTLIDKNIVFKNAEISRKQYEFIKSKLEDSKEKLTELIISYIDDSSYFDTGDTDMFKLEIPNIEFIDFNIHNVDEESAYVNCETKIRFIAHVEFEDYENAFYDKEDDEWYLLEHKSTELKKEINIPVNFEVSYNIEENEFDIYELSVNNDNVINLDNLDFGHPERFK